MTPEELDRLDALLASAHQVEGCSDHGCVLRVYRRGGMGTNGGCRCVSRDDADGMVSVRAARLDLTRLLALARQTPALVAEVRRLRAEVDGLRGALVRVHGIAETLAAGNRHTEMCPARRWGWGDCQCSVGALAKELAMPDLRALLAPR